MHGIVIGWGEISFEAEYHGTPNNLEIFSVNTSCCYKNFVAAQFSSPGAFCTDVVNQVLKFSVAFKRGGGFFIKDSKHLTWNHSFQFVYSGKKQLRCFWNIYKCRFIQRLD